MKKFKETNETLYERSSHEKLALDLALLDEADGDMCSIPLDQLKSKVMRNRHKKMCGKSKNQKKSMWSKAAHKAAGGRHKLYNSLEELKSLYAEGTDDNLVVLIRDITSEMIGAIKKGDLRKLKGLYKNLGRIIR